jgi:hypothetical protein
MNAPSETVADSARDAAVPPARRLFVTEPGWRVSMKSSSAKEFCHTMAPGQDYYHRLLNGEIYVHRGEELLCLACATRRGLLVHEPKRLAEVVIAVPKDTETIPLDSKWADLESGPDIIPISD